MSNSDNEPQAPLDQQPVSDDEPATVAWFDLDKQFGFVALSNGYEDAFLHMLGAEGGWLRVGPAWNDPAGQDRG